MKQLVIGRSGSGKTTYIVNQIKEDLKAGYENILLIVPDQFTFETERELIRHTGKGLFEIRVLSFRRLIDVLRDELGTKGCNVLDDVNKAMYVNKLLYDYDNELSVYKGGYRVPGFSYDMARAITECKQFGATYSDLEGLSLKGKTGTKVEDICAIYKAYTNFKGGFYDNEDVINIITDRMVNSRVLQGARVYIDHFDVFTFQGYKMIEQMGKICSSLTVCLCSDGSKRGLFALTTNTMDKVKEVVPDIDMVEIKRQGSKNDICHLEENLFENEPANRDKPDGSVELFSFGSVLGEIDHAAAKIIELKNKGYKYMDIALMTGDIDEYSKVLEQTMLDCGIPYYIDKKVPLSASRISKFLIYALKNCYTFEPGNYIGMLKQGIMVTDMDDVNRYENYILAYGLKRALAPIKNDDILDRVRSSIKLSTLKNAVSRAKCVQEMTKAAMEFLSSFDIAFESEIEERFFNKLMDVLEKMGAIFGDTKIELPLFIAILNTGITSVELGVIPEKRDCVIIGDISRSKIESAKCLLVLGVRDGVIPKVTEKSGLLSDYDTTIIGKHIKVGRDSLDLNNLEQLLTYKMLSKPRDYLYLSHSQRSLFGTEHTADMLFAKVAKILSAPINADIPFNEEMSKRLLISKKLAFRNLVADALGGENNYITRGVMSYFYKEGNLESLLKPRSYDLSITKDQAQSIYENTVISASRIELFNKCPFSQFVRYGLSPKERRLYKIDRLDTGSLLHSIIERFSLTLMDKVSEYRKNSMDLHGLYDEMRSEIITSKMVDTIVKNQMEENELTIYDEDGIGRVMAKRLTLISKKALVDILNNLRDSDFVMSSSEADLKSFGSYEIDGKELYGRVDRVDYSDNGIAVIDYKQSGSELNYPAIYSGVKIQLFLYMAAIIKGYKDKGEVARPLSLQYYNVAMDNQSYDSVDSFMKATGANKVSKIEVGTAKGNTTKVIDQESMDSLVRFVEFHACRSVEKMYNGDVSISPFYIDKKDNNACKFCNFQDICKNDDFTGGRHAKKVMLEDIIGGEDNVE